MEKSVPFGSGMEQADLDPEEEDLIGHTWLTHAKLKSSALQESYGIRGDRVGKVVWHSLMRNGKVTQYDIRFGRKVIRNIPAALVEADKVQEHKHEGREEK